MTTYPVKTKAYARLSGCATCKRNCSFSTTKPYWPALKGGESAPAGLAGLKGSESAYLSPSPKPVSSMKNYILCVFNSMKQHISFIIDNAGMTIASLLGGFGAWFLEFTEIYIFADFRYLVFLLLMVCYDAYSGIAKTRYLHRKDPAAYPAPSSKVFKDKTFSKLMYYVIVLASLHGLAHFQVKNQEVTIFHAFEYTAMISIMATEFWSIQENYAAMDKRTLINMAWEWVQKYLQKKTDGNSH